MSPTALRILALDVYETVDDFGEGVAVNFEKWCARYGKTEDPGARSNARRRWERLKERVAASPFQADRVHDFEEKTGRGVALVFARGTRDLCLEILEGSKGKPEKVEASARAARASYRRKKKTAAERAEVLENAARRYFRQFGVTGVTPEEICALAFFPATPLNVALVEGALIEMSLEDVA